MQKDPNNKIVYTPSDIKKFFGILLFMSVQRFQNTRAYWHPVHGYGPVSSTMNSMYFVIYLDMHIHLNCMQDRKQRDLKENQA